MRANANIRDMCIFHRFSHGFSMIFVSRLFFERIGPLERKANEKPAKSTPRAPKIDLRSTKIALRSPFRTTSVDQVDRKCLFERCWVDLVGRKSPSERLSRRLGSILARSRGPSGRSGRSARRPGPEPPTGNSNMDIMYVKYIIY